MRIILVGASGDIGQAAFAALTDRHDIITVGRSTGDMQVDISDPAAVASMFHAIGPIDAVVSTAGDVRFLPLAEQTHETFRHGLHQKVMGQINLVLEGRQYVRHGGSFTLTSGILDRDPIVNGTGAALANGALGGFVVGAAIEMPNAQRINVVSPGMLETSAKRYGPWFAGHNPVCAKRVGRAYVKSVEGAQTGQVIKVD